MNKVDIAWAAGIFEGEGCIHVQGNGVALSLEMTDRDIVERFYRAIGCLGVVRTPKVPKNPAGGDYKTQYRWGCYNYEHAQAILAYFWMFLGERRKARTVEALTRAVSRTRAFRAGLNRNQLCATPECNRSVHTVGLCLHCYGRQRKEYYRTLAGQTCSCGNPIRDGSDRRQCKDCIAAAKRRYNQRKKRERCASP